MTRVCRGQSRHNEFIAETDWALDREVTSAGYREWLAGSGSTDQGEDTFQKYIRDAVMDAYKRNPAVHWLNSEGTIWTDAKGVKDGEDAAGNFVGITLTIPDKEAAERFSAEWLR